MGIRTCGLSESIAIHSRTCTGPQVDILLGSFLTYFSAQDFILVSAQFVANLSPYHGRARHEVIKTYKNRRVSDRGELELYADGVSSWTSKYHGRVFQVDTVLVSAHQFTSIPSLTKHSFF